MSISSKIGCTIVTLENKKPNFNLLNYLNKKHPPLTPDLFPYYAGTFDDVEDDDEYYGEEVDFDETYQDELEVLNNPSFEDIDKISKIVEEVEFDEEERSFSSSIDYEEVSKKLDEIDGDKVKKSEYSNFFNDIVSSESKKESTPTFKVSEPVKLDVVEEKKVEEEVEIDEFEPLDKKEELVKEEVKVSAAEVNSEQSIDGNEPKFVVKANEKNKYYSDVLETVENLFEKKA